MKQNYLLLVGLTATLNLSAQLDTVTYFNQVINDLKVFNGDLHIAGGFTNNQGSTCYWSAYYDGTMHRHTDMIGGSGIRELAVFDNDLYHAGTLQLGSGVGVGVWDGYSWDDAGSTNYSHSTIYADVNHLYVESDNGLIRRKTAGGSWETVYDFAGAGGLGSIIRFGSDIIFGGSFSSINGVTASNIVAWNGSTFTPLGAGLNGGVGTMAVYNNELYVTGSFTLAGSTTVSKIAKWNGSTWSDVGTGLTGASFGSGITDMVVHNNKLYVVGGFDKIGGGNAMDFAYWNGSSWTGINWNHPESQLRCIEVYNNEIYIGAFDFSKARLYRYIGGVGIEEKSEFSGIEIYPNPSNGIYTIQSENLSGAIEYKIFTSQGKEIQSGNGTQIDLSSEVSGIYFATILSEGNSITYKLIKE